ncbi:MAG: helix-turn-helix domain containing protein [Novosphingobium sp.]|nr:helix-turn-helix domain containing protein [Novosphingobium sp.]
MAERINSSDAIVAAACRLLAKLGSHERLTLSAVAAEAGVSRPTLYRWFATREDLLEAMALSQEDRFYEGLAEALERVGKPAERLDAALGYLVSYLDEAFGAESPLLEPGFTVRNLAASLPKQRSIWARLVGDALARLPAVKSGEMSVDQAAELFLRLAYSHYLIPSSEPDVLLQCMRSMAGIGTTNKSDGPRRSGK